MILSPEKVYMKLHLTFFYKILASSKTIWAFPVCQILSWCMLIFHIWAVYYLWDSDCVQKKVAGYCYALHLHSYLIYTGHNYLRAGLGIIKISNSNFSVLLLVLFLLSNYKIGGKHIGWFKDWSSLLTVY